MKKIILLFILFFLLKLSAYAIIYKNPEFPDFRINFSETANISDAFLSKSCLHTNSKGDITPRSYEQLRFCGIDSDNNIHILKEESRSYEDEESKLELIFKLEPEKHIFITLLGTIIEFAISPINSSRISVKVFPPDGYVKEP